MVDPVGCFENPENWKVNHVLPLEGEVMKKMGLTTLGTCYVQMRFLPFGQKDDGILPPTIEDLEGPVEEKIIGALKVNIMHVRGAFEAGEEAQKVYCLITANNQGFRFKTAVTEAATSNPVWSQQFTADLDFMSQNYAPFKCDIFSEDDTLLSTCAIRWRKCVHQPLEWVVNDRYKL